MKKPIKLLTLSALFFSATSFVTAMMNSPQQLNRDMRVASDREVVMSQVEIDNTVTSSPRGPAYINRHARISSQRDALITETSESSEKITDIVMSEPTASQKNRHN